jgi:hypothetical protein
MVKHAGPSLRSNIPQTALLVALDTYNLISKAVAKKSKSYFRKLYENVFQNLTIYLLIRIYNRAFPCFLQTNKTV